MRTDCRTGAAALLQVTATMGRLFTRHRAGLLAAATPAMPRPCKHFSTCLRLPATHVMHVSLLPVATEPRWQGSTWTGSSAGSMLLSRGTDACSMCAPAHKGSVGSKATLATQRA